MTLNKFLYEDIRTVRNNNVILTSYIRNSFYKSGYNNFYEILITPIETLKQSTNISTARLNYLNNQLSAIDNRLQIGISLDILHQIYKEYYSQYYSKKLKISYQRHIFLIEYLKQQNEGPSSHAVFNALNSSLTRNNNDC